MTQAYSNPDREQEETALPDLEIFQLTAHEVAARDEDLVHEYMHRHEFRLAGMNSRDRDKMLDAMCEEEGITGGWFYWYCFPGCLTVRRWDRMLRTKKPWTRRAKTLQASADLQIGFAAGRETLPALRRQ